MCDCMYRVRCYRYIWIADVLNISPWFVYRVRIQVHGVTTGSQLDNSSYIEMNGVFYHLTVDVSFEHDTV